MCGFRPDQIEPLRWEADGLSYVDQRFLPREVRYERATDVRAVIDAIQSLAVAGARCVDIFSGFGVVLARLRAQSDTDVAEAVRQLRCVLPSNERATSALERVFATPRGSELPEALEIAREQQNVDRSIARYAAALVPTRANIVTHGATGAFSTGGCGTSVGAIIVANESGKRPHVYIGETRPRLTGLRLTAFELAAAGVTCTVFPDGSAAALMRTIPVNAIFVGAEKVAANGDALAEIGTYALALAAAHHRIPFYLTVPRAAIDATTQHGDRFEIAHATSDEQRSYMNATGAQPQQHMHAALYDVTPGHLIGGIITEYGLIRPPYDESLRTVATRPRFAFLNPTSAAHATVQ